MCTIIAIGNQKGGVGKTTTTLNLANALVTRGRQVLMVDVDPQHSLTKALDLDHPQANLSHVMGDYRDGTKVLKEVIVRVRDRLYLVPSHIDLQTSEMGMMQRLGRESILVEALKTTNLNGVHYILIDCPPSLDLLTINALVAADSVLIPVQAEIMALMGLALFRDTIVRVKKKLNPDLRILGLVPTMLRKGRGGWIKHHRKILAALDKTGMPLLCPIPMSIQAADAILQGTPGYALNGDSVIAQAYAQLAVEVERVR
jgi:chromosome partitioning protein